MELAISSEIPSGIFTNFSSGTICFSEYPPIGADALQTRSPILKSLTSEPISSIIPHAVAQCIAASF